MPIFSEKKFISKIPHNKRQHIEKNVKQFDECFREHKYDFNKYPQGFHPEPFGNIISFRVSEGERVLVDTRYFADIGKQGRDELKGQLLYLIYLSSEESHKSLNKNISKWLQKDISKSDIINLSEEDEKKIDDHIKSQYEYLNGYELKKHFEFENDTFKRPPENSITNIFSKKSSDYLWLLDEHQNRLLKQPPPLFITGSAGSGKTEVLIQKLLSYSSRGLNCAYFTYTNHLKKYAVTKTKNWLNNLNVKFYSFEEYSLKYTSATENHLIKFERFAKWFDESLKRHSRDWNKFDVVDVWCEIRGMIKGFMGENWIRKRVFSKRENIINGDSINYLVKYGWVEELDKGKCIIKKTDRDIEKIIKKEILYNGSIESEKKATLTDDVDKLFKYMAELKCSDNLIDIDIYCRLPIDYSLYNKEQKIAIYKIASEYQKWLNENSHYDENDLILRLLQQKDNLEKYDVIACDEIQDLSELQIYFINKLLKEKNGIILSGDIHQTINPTYFNPKRIKNLFYSQSSEFISKQLIENYRSQDYIIELANKLSDVRIKAIGSLGMDDDYEEISHKSGDKPFLLKYSDDNLKNLLDTVSKTSYAVIIVPDEKEKIRLLDYGKEPLIYTIQEAKGLEFQYVICYNLLSKYSEYWEDIMKGIGKTNTKYRYYFNIFYVAITRASTNLCILEENCSILESMKLQEYFNPIVLFDKENMLLEEYSTPAEWIERAINNEDHEIYKQAEIAYKKAGDMKGEKRCCAKQCALEGDFNKAGDLMSEIEEFKLAIEYYKKVDNIGKIIIKEIQLGHDKMKIYRTWKQKNISILEVLIKNMKQLEKKEEKPVQEFFYHIFKEYKEDCDLLTEYITDVPKKIMGE